MDTELARTFLTVLAAGNFGKAAERLFVTQSTVSSRIKSLEDQLGCKLFLRNKGGTTLTAAGQQFQKHAVNLIRTVEQARHAVGITQGYRASLTIGGRFGIWEELLLHCLPAMRTAAPDIALSAEIGSEDELMLGIVEGHIDIGVMYTPQSRPGLKVELLFEQELVMVVTESAESGPPLATNYVYVDWGSEFRARHNASFPDFTGSGITTNTGWLGLQHILQHGGSGYFPRRLVQKQCDAGSLQLVRHVPTFKLHAYLVYPLEHDPSVLVPILDIMRSVVHKIEAS